MIKQVILVRKDLGMSTGKMIAQACHACLNSYQKAEKDIIKEWKSHGEKKVSLEVNSEEELIQLNQEAKDIGLPTFLVRDAGLTELEPGTVTALGIGPDKEEKIDKITGNTKLL